jgi:colicin import membrane protein
MQQLLSSLEDERQRQFRRFVVLSAALHLALGFLFWWSPLKPSGTALPAVVRVDLVTMADIAPAPKPVPAPAARPPPPPPPPPEVKKVLPKQPAPLPKPKPVEAKPKPEKPKPQDKPKEKPKQEPKPPEPAPEQDYEDVLAQLRQEAGETTPKPVEQAQAAPAGGPAGLGRLVSPEEARWMRDAKMHVTRAWILEPGFRLQQLETKIEVDIGPTGEVLGTRITQSSGNPWYDESVERAIQKASPLPAPPEADKWPFSFKPSDLR